MMKGRMGTPTYMAPELWVKHMQYTSAVDMWAIGVTAYLLLCGTRPFHHRDIDVKVSAAQSRLFISAIFSPPRTSSCAALGPSITATST